MRTSTMLLAALAFSAPAWAEDPPSFTVLKVAQGDDTDFKVTAAKEASAEKSRIQKEAKAALAEWEQQRDAFLADKANKKKRFRDPKPEPVSVTKAKDGFASQEEAQKFASEEKSKADGKYAVLKITDTDKSTFLVVLLQKKVKTKDREFADKFENELEDYKEKQVKFYSDPNLTKYNPPLIFKEVPPEKPKILRLKENLPDRDAAEKAKEELEKAEPQK